MKLEICIQQSRSVAVVVGVAAISYLIGGIFGLAHSGFSGGIGAALAHARSLLGPVPDAIGRVLWSVASSLDKTVAFDRGVLTTLAQIEGVIAGIAIPLSLDMVARISDRYHSNVVTEHFRGIGAVKYFPHYVLASLLLTVGVLLWQGRGPWTRLAHYAAGILFVGACYWLLRFLRIMQEHTDSRYLLRKFNEAARKITRS